MTKLRAVTALCGLGLAILPGASARMSASGPSAAAGRQCTTDPVVTTLSENGLLGTTLRDAIAVACPGSTITFSVSGTINLNFTFGPINLNGSITIDGANAITVRQPFLNVPVFISRDGSNVTLEGLTIRDARYDFGSGGGIYVEGGSLTIRNCWITNNRANYGGGIATSNAAGAVTIIDSTISGNTALDSGGGIANSSSLTIENSTISGNTAAGYGGGISTGGYTSIVNTTITNNRADSNDDATGIGGGMYIGGGTTVLHNTIVAGNTRTSGASHDIYGAIWGGSVSNLIGNGTNMSGISNGSNGNQVGTSGSPIDPRLGGLAFNGGKTPTHLLLSNSPAIDAGDDAMAAIVGLTKDQQGFFRYADGPDGDTTTTVDIGAVEYIEQTINEDSHDAGSPLQITFDVGDVGAGDSIDDVSATSGNHTLAADPTVEGTGSVRTLSIETEPNQNGTSTITVSVTKTIGGTPATTSYSFLLTVNSVNDPPTLNPISDQAVNEDSGSSGISLSGITEGPLETQNLTVTAESSDTSIVPNPTASYTGSPGFYILSFQPVANQSGVVTITVFVTDDGGTANGGANTFSRSFTLTVNPVAEAPQVTPASTSTRINTRSGAITIGPGTPDGSEIQYFRITAVTNGAVYRAGDTPLPPGGLLTAAEAAAGVTFQPSLDSAATGTFKVRGQADAGGNGAGPDVDVTLSIDLHSTSTTVSSDPNPSDSNGVTVVSFTVASTTGGPTPTGNVDVTISGSAETCSATLTSGSGSCALTLADPGVDRTITATYLGDTWSNGSVGTTLHTVKACPINPVVANTNDSGPGSLRQAIVDACGGDTITFAIPTLGPDTITLASELILNKSLTITGSTGKSLIISGNNLSRVFNAQGNTDITLEYLTIREGAVTGAGGGILINGPDLLIRNSTLTANSATVRGSAVALDGGAVTFHNTTISGNGGPVAAISGLDATFTGFLNATVTANAGAGLEVAASGITIIGNTVIAGNSGTDVIGPVSQTSPNFLGGDPKLGPLQNNGGPTSTHLPLANSPVLDTGDSGAVIWAGLTTDQRGVPRILAGPGALAANVDLGATEARASLAFSDPAPVIEGTPAKTVTINVGDSSLITSVTATSLNPAVVGSTSISASGPSRTLFLFPTLPDGYGTAQIDIAVSTASETVHGTLTLEVLGTADQPSITNATTLEDTLSSTGLVISRNPADGPEVTHFKITTIDRGRLFKPDGVTEIHEGDFVTFAEGHAGLRFLPSPDSDLPGTVIVQASVSGNDTGVSGGTAAATITVTPVADAPIVPTGATAVEDVPTDVSISRGGGDGLEVTHYQITAITGGTMFLSDGVTPIVNGDFIAAGAGATSVVFLPAPDSIADGHFTARSSIGPSVAGLSAASATATIHIVPVADPPVVTPATTLAGVQTTSGLQITRNPADHEEVTSFKIMGVQFGALYLHDGVTPLSTGSVVTIEQAAEGLRYTPGPGFTGTANVFVAGQAVAGGLTGSGVVTVGKHSTQTTITSHDPNPSEQSAAMTVKYAVTSTTGGPDPTGTVSVSGGGGLCTGLVSAGMCTLTMTTSGAGQTITATYAGDSVSLGSIGTATHDVRACPSFPTVTTTADSGPGSLRQALVDACAEDLIVFAIPGPGPHTILLTSGPLVVDKPSVALLAPGGARVRISGNHASRVLDVTDASIVFGLIGLTVMDGSADEGAGIRAGGEMLLLLDTTLTGNAATGHGGGLLLTSPLGLVQIAHGTISGNSAADGSAIWSDGALTALYNSTVTANTGGGAAVVVTGIDAVSGAVNSIIAGNDGPNLSVLGDAPFQDVGGNLLAGDPMLGPLQDNGGPVPTHMPLPGSPAIDGGTDNDFFLNSDIDARGFPRVVDGPDADTTATIDIGAVEVVPSVGLIAPQSAVEDGAPVPLTFSLGHLSMPFDSIVATSSDQAVVSDANLAITGSDDTRTLTITLDPNHHGTATITVAATAQIPNLLAETVGPVTATSSFLLTVSPASDVPAVTPVTTPEDTPVVVVVTPNAADGAEITHFRVSGAMNGTVFKPDGITPIADGGIVTRAEAATGLRFGPAPNLFSPAATFGFSVEAAMSAAGDGLSPAAFASVTVTPVADTPSVTNASTLANQQTTSGLVVTNNAVDGAEVTHVRISGISGGALFQHDGVTPIADGAFITIAQGAAGLRFTPALDSVTTGHVSVQSSIGATIGGLGGGIVTADIAIDRDVTSTAVTTSGSPSNVGVSVTFTATVTPSTATGTVQFMDAGTPLGSPVALSGGVAAFTTASLAAGLHTITASYGGNTAYEPSTATLTGGQIILSGRTVLTGADAGGGPHVRRFTAIDGSAPISGALDSFFAFNPSFAGGVRVAEGDVNGDGQPDYIAGTGPGGGPQINVFDGATGALMTSFLAFDPEFTGGVFVAAGDVDGDGFADIVAGSGAGRSGQVKVFSGRDGSVLRDMFVFPRAFTGGISVAAGDVNGDGRADLVVGSGPGMPAEVRVLNANDGSTLRAFTPYGGFVGGVWVAAGDVTGDGFADIVTGAGPGGGPHVLVVDGVTGAATLSFFAFDPAFTGGVRVATGDVNGDGHADIIAGAGPGGGPQVSVFDGVTAASISAVMAYPVAFPGGVFVATAVPLNRMAVNPPAPDAVISGPFTVAGWAFVDHPTTAGIAAIHVWAVPITGATPTFLGLATLGDARPDVAAFYGAQYGHAGFHLDAAAPPPGDYYIAVFAQSSVTGTFQIVRVAKVTITP